MLRAIALAPGLVLGCILFGCGAVPPPPSRALPDDAAARDAAIMALGEAAWQALEAGDPFTLLADEAALAVLVDDASIERVEARRPGFRARLGSMVHELPTRLAGATYLGICAQDSRDEPRGGALGLVGRNWVVGRVLVAGRIASTSRRIALWIDGPFVFDGERFVALELENVEEPRWEHSDLELGACDISEGL